jgi:uncharacterized protein YqfB (UPF0267 family)
VNFASRVLDYNSKDILADNSLFRIPNEIESGDHFSKEVCWFETLDSKAVLVEIKVKAWDPLLLAYINNRRVDSYSITALIWIS